MQESVMQGKKNEEKFHASTEVDKPYQKKSSKEKDDDRKEYFLSNASVKENLLWFA